MTHKRKSEKRLDVLYETLPKLDCKGLCQVCCGPIAMTPAEFRRIVELTGIEPTVDSDGVCSLLKAGQCSVYEIRPTICRLWGVLETMKCPHGCTPTPRFLTKEEGYRFMDKVDKATGRKGLKSTIDGIIKFNIEGVRDKK